MGEMGNHRNRPHNSGVGGLGRGLVPRGARPWAATIGIVAGVLLLAQALDGPAAPAAGTTSPATASPPAPASVAAVPYSGGRALVTWSPGSGTESDTYHVEIFRYSNGATVDQGGIPAIGSSTVVQGLQPGSTYLFAVNALNGAGSGPVSRSGTITAVGSVAPTAPTGATLSTNGTDNQLTLTWNPVSTPVAPERYNVGVFQGVGSARQQVGAVSCDSPCTSMVIQARPGTVTSAVVSGSNPIGTSGSTWSNAVTVPQPCWLACLTVATAAAGTALGHQPAGFLDPNGPANPTGLVPAQWRTNAHTLSQTPSSVLQGLKGASLTEILSDDWLTGHNLAGYAFTPWSNWSAYSQWVGNEVRAIEALGAQRGFSITYWEVQNEPFGGHYYSLSSQPPASETIANFEEQFLLAYQAIKAADPSAQVIGPSLIAWNANPGDTPGVGIDMRTFLDFCVNHGVRLGGVSFHVNAFNAIPGWYAAQGTPAQPSAVQAQVDQLRSMLAARPSVGNPAILVNEYGSPYTWQMPGWGVGWLSALDTAGVTGAGRSCWDSCGASLDGLLTGTGSATLPSYWVYNFFTSLGGRTVPVASSYSGVTGLASMATNGVVSVLVGRHENCTRAVNLYCPALPAEPVTIQVQVPGASTASVAMAVIPAGSNTGTPLTSVSPYQVAAPVTNGWATVTTPSLHDGDAVEVMVTPGT